MDLGSRLRRAPVASSGHPHLAAEPVTVGLLVNLHDDVVHLRDPHKPVALQEPGSELGSALEPGMLGLHGARGIGGNRASLPTPRSPGRVGGEASAAPDEGLGQEVGTSEPFLLGASHQSPHQCQCSRGPGIINQQSAGT